MMCANFTTDRNRLWEALNALGVQNQPDSTPTAGLAGGQVSLGTRWTKTGPSVGSVRGMTEGMESMLSDAELSTDIGIIRRYDRETYTRGVHDYLSEMQDLAKALDVLPGRKFFVLFSAGFDMNKAFLGGADPTALPKYVDQEIGKGDVGRGQPRTDMMKLAAQAMAAFSSSDCRFYSLDTAGLQGTNDVADFEADGRPRKGEVGEHQGPIIQKVCQDSLAELASEAGGRFLGSLNDLDKALLTLDRETGQYYVLGYQSPSSKGQGEYHKIRVEVARPGVSVSFRKGYYEAKPFADFTELERDLQIAAIVDKQLEQEQIPFTAQVYGFRPDSNAWTGLSESMVQMAIPASAGAKWSASSIEMYGFARAEDGSIVDAFHAVPDLSETRQAEDAVRHGISYSDVLMLKPGRYQIRLIVRDTRNGLVGAHTLPYEAIDFSSTTPFISTPCFISTGSSMLNIRGFDPQRASPRFPSRPPEYPISFQKKNCVAAVLPDLSRRKECPLLLKLYGVPSDPATGGPRARIGWRISGLDGSGEQPVECELRGVEHHPSTTQTDLLFIIRAPELTPGFYVLNVSVRDEQSGTTITGKIAFQIS